MFEGVLDLIEPKRLMDSLTFQLDWCDEFYATCYFGKDEDHIAYWMKDG